MRVLVLATLLSSSALSSAAQAQEVPTFVFDQPLEKDGPPFVLLDFDVGAGVKEVEVRHASVDDDDIVDFGLEDADDGAHSFRGWGGGNDEPAVVNEFAASRSYHPGAIGEGVWHVVVGKAQLLSDAPAIHVEVFLRDAVTLPPDTDRAPYAPATLSSTARFYAGDLHVHSRDSGDARPDLDEIAAFARGLPNGGLDFVVVTDHNTDAQLERFVDAQSRHDDLLFVPGVEFTTYGGHATGFGVTSYVDHKIGLTTTVQDAVDAVHAQGALFSINHPVLDLGDVCIGCAWVNDVPAVLDGVEVATGGYDEVGFLFNTAARDFWDALLDDGSHAAPVGGSDDHKAGVDEGAFGSSIGSPTTMIFASELSAAALTEGLKNNRVVVKLQGTEDAMIDLQTRPERTGDTVVAAGTVTLTATITGGTGLQARFMKHGFPIEDDDGNEEVVDVDSDPFVLEREVVVEDGERYRVELLEEGHVEVLTGHVWLAQLKGGDDEIGCCDAGSGGLPLLGVPLLLLLRRRRR